MGWSETSSNSFSRGSLRKTRGPSLPQSPPHARCNFCKRSFYSEEARKTVWKTRKAPRSHKNPWDWIHPLGGFKHDQKMSIFFQRLTQWIPVDPKTWGRHGWIGRIWCFFLGVNSPGFSLKHGETTLAGAPPGGLKSSQLGSWSVAPRGTNRECFFRRFNKQTGGESESLGFSCGKPW